MNMSPTTQGATDAASGRWADHDQFYRAFEDRFRGSRDLIKKRLEVYLPFVLPLHDRLPDAPSLDLGCGRGEWLELLKDRDISVVGIDMDDGMLQDCRDLELPAHHGEALTYLTTLPAESQLIVSAFHVVEHVDFQKLRMIVSEALRVLKPGGLLILETPNPENIRVGSCSFYLDPTHINPIPPDLLSFVTAYSGFARSKIVRLQESPDLGKTRPISMMDLLAGSSSDYAIVAQKSAEQDIMNSVSGPFNQSYGVRVEDLSIRRDFQNRELVSSTKIGLEHLERRLGNVERQLVTLHRSLSWRITKPLRAVSSFLGLSRGSKLRAIVKVLIFGPH